MLLTFWSQSSFAEEIRRCCRTRGNSNLAILPSGRIASQCKPSAYASTPLQVLRRGVYNARAADVWAAGVLLWALVGGGFAFLRPDEEALDRIGRMRVMEPRIFAGAYRSLPEVRTCSSMFVREEEELLNCTARFPKVSSLDPAACCPSYSH